MSGQAEKRARAEAMLGELAEHALMVAKELAVRLRETEDADQAVALAGAFQKVSRVVRLTLALDFKLERDAAREAREQAREAEKAQAEAMAEAIRSAPEPAPEPRAPDPVKARKDRVSNLLYRLLWTESEGDSEEFEVLQEDLNARLDEAALSPAFETTPIEVIVQRVIADMGLTGPFTLTVGEAPPAAASTGGGGPRKAVNGARPGPDLSG